MDIGKNILDIIDNKIFYLPNNNKYLNKLYNRFKNDLHLLKTSPIFKKNGMYNIEYYTNMFYPFDRLMTILFGYDRFTNEFYFNPNKIDSILYSLDISSVIECLLLFDTGQHTNLYYININNYNSKVYLFYDDNKYLILYYLFLKENNKCKSDNELTYIYYYLMGKPDNIIKFYISNNIIFKMPTLLDKEYKKYISKNKKFEFSYANDYKSKFKFLKKYKKDELDIIFNNTKKSALIIFNKYLESKEFKLYIKKKEKKIIKFKYNKKLYNKYIKLAIKKYRKDHK